ncbi:MAG: ornithine aminomutase subunit alpha [Candidatus Izemoplasmatales bacterium]|jgi:D-ornithine 4,5-aminomutase subunit alpha
MTHTNQRPDDYESRRKHLENMSDQDLKDYFWSLADKAVKPLIDLAKTHTTPAIERSILLRMGFSSIEAKAIVDKVIQHGLIGKGAGHVVYRHYQIYKQTIRQSGLALLADQGWQTVENSFKVAK